MKDPGILRLRVLSDGGLSFDMIVGKDVCATSVATSLAEFQVALPTVVEETVLGALSLAHLTTTPGYICMIAATHISRCIALSLIRPSKRVFSSSVPAKLQAQGNIKNQLATYLESGPGSEMSSKSNAK